MSVESPFYKEEYIALRKEIEMILAEHTQLRFYCVLGLAVVISWVASRTYPSIQAAYLAWAVVIGIPLLGAYSSWERNRHLCRIGKYIRLVEAHCIPQVQDSPKGWEHFHADKNRTEVAVADGVFWGGLIVFSIVAAVVGTWDLDSQANDSSNAEFKLGSEIVCQVRKQ